MPFFLTTMQAVACSELIAAATFKLLPLTLKRFIMKSICFYAIALSMLLLISCNPMAGKDIITEVVKLNATISNTSETILLGETLQIKLTLPDSVTSNMRTQRIQSLERAFFAMSTFKVDTVMRTVTNITAPAIWISAGTLEGNFSYVLRTNPKPYEVVINFKPTERGMYYFEVIPQPGTLRINGNSESNLLVNFAAIDKHLTLLSPTFGQEWLNAGNQRIAEGFGVYAFRVN